MRFATDRRAPAGPSSAKRKKKVDRLGLGTKLFTVNQHYIPKTDGEVRNPESIFVVKSSISSYRRVIFSFLKRALALFYREEGEITVGVALQKWQANKYFFFLIKRQKKHLLQELSLELWHASLTLQTTRKLRLKTGFFGHVQTIAR